MSASTDGQLISVLRSEERLRADVVRVPVRRAVLRKVIVSEEQTITVTVRREEFHLDFEILDTDGDLATSPVRPVSPTLPIEVVLHEERIEVVRSIVPVERVLVDIRAVAEEQSVAGDVRVERVEIVGVEGADSASPVGRHRG